MAPLPSPASLPVGDLAADAMASTVIYEIDETPSAADLDGRFDENAGTCPWTSGPPHRSPAGAWATLGLGGQRPAGRAERGGGAGPRAARRAA